MHSHYISTAQRSLLPSEGIGLVWVKLALRGRAGFDCLPYFSE